MAQPTLYINGVDRTDYLAIDSGQISRDMNGIAEFRGVLRQANRDFYPSKRDTIVIEQGNIKRFSGSIYSVIETDAGGTEGIMEYELLCVDHNHTFARRLFTGDIPAGTSLYTAVSMVAGVSLTGENIALTGVENPGPLTAEDLSFRYELVKDVFAQISRVTGGYLFYADFDKVLHFSAFNPNTASFSCTDTSDNWRNMRVERSDEFYVNRMYVRTDHNIV